MSVASGDDAPTTLVAELRRRRSDPLETRREHGVVGRGTSTPATRRARGAPTTRHRALGRARRRRRVRRGPCGARASTADSIRSSRASSRCSSRRATRRTRSTADLRRADRRAADRRSSRGSRGTAARSTARRSTTTTILDDPARRATTAAQRRAAWEASKTVGAEVAADVRELARLRNDAARSLGYRDHFAMTLATTEFDEHRLFATLDEVDAITAAPFRAMEGRARRPARGPLRRRASTSCGRGTTTTRSSRSAPGRCGVDLDPYFDDLDLDAADRCAPSTASGSTSAPCSTRSDLLPRDGKVPARVLHRRRPRRRRARALQQRSRPSAGPRRCCTSSGTRVYFDGVDRELPWLLRTMHMCLHRGRRDAVRPARARAGVARARSPACPPRRSTTLAPRLARRAPGAAARLRPLGARDDALRARPVRRPRRPTTTHRGGISSSGSSSCTGPTGRNAPDWAAKIHLAVAPVYYQNYLYGELIASQLSATLNERFGGIVDRPEAGTFLAREIFTPGARARWDQLIEQATGSPFTAEVLAHELAAR